MMHRQVPNVVLSTAVKHLLLPREQAVMNGLSLLHAVGPEPPLQAGALQASIAWRWLQ